MRLRVVTYLVLFLAGLVAPATAALPQVVTSPEGNIVLLLAENEEITAQDTRTGATLWTRELPGAFSASVFTAAGHWVLATESYVVALDHQGEEVWSRELSASLLAATEPTPGLLVLASEGRLTALDAGTGRELWSAELPSPSVQALEGTLLARSRDRLVWLEPTTGELLGEASIEGLATPPVPLGEGNAVFATTPDALVRAHPEGVVWSAPLVAPTVLKTPEGLAAVAEERFSWLDPATGAVRWSAALNGRQVGELAVGPETVIVLVAKEEELEAVVFSRDDGSVVTTHVYPGEFVRSVLHQERMLVFLRLPAREPKLDPSGRPVLDLKTGEPQQEDAAGYQLVALRDAEPPTVLDAAPREGLVGPIQLIGESLVYATQLVRERQEGVPIEVDPRYPYEPVVIRGVHLPDDTLWSYQSDDAAQRPSKDRLKESTWDTLKDTLLFTNQADQLTALDPAKGKVLWQSRPLGLDESPPAVVPLEDGRIFVIAQQKELLDSYALTSEGNLEWSRRLTPLFIADKLNHLVGVLVICLALMFFIYAARRRELFLRRIAGLNALDEAVGRATEMGKPVLYVSGLADVDDIQTLASLSILGHVAKRTAEYDTPILVPTSRAVVMSTAQEVVKESYTAAGRPDAYNADNVMYISDDQFGWVAGIDGMMLREKPAANFYMGCFYAESLILAETGNATGAIQIAGTAMPSQLPFFVAACDYTLIGEELFAASAYLSRDPLQVGSLRGQDVGKAIVMVCLLLGPLALSLGYTFVKELFSS